MKDRESGRVPRRRRSWYRRRLKVQRTLAGAILAVLVAASCWQTLTRAFRSTSPPSSHVLASTFTSSDDIHQELAWTLPRQGKRQYLNRIPGVYPYSVVPGGVQDSASLRRAAARDRAIARHYANFDYNKARLIRIREPRAVYVSYRIRDTIFWTRKKIMLHAGEPLLTDGNITARAKCGNQISDSAKPEVSDEEPEQDILDQAVALEPLGPPLPLRPQLRMPELPAGPPVAPVYAGGYSFPLVPIGGPAVVCAVKDGSIDKHCRPHHKNPATPEPPAFVLLASGLAVLGWRYRKNRPAAA